MFERGNVVQANETANGLIVDQRYFVLSSDTTGVTVAPLGAGLVPIGGYQLTAFRRVGSKPTITRSAPAAPFDWAKRELDLT